MVRMDDMRLVIRVMKAEVSRRRLRGRPKFGWMNSMKQALGRRDISVEVTREHAVNKREWRMDEF